MGSALQHPGGPDLPRERTLHAGREIHRWAIGSHRIHSHADEQCVIADSRFACFASNDSSLPPACRLSLSRWNHVSSTDAVSSRRYFRAPKQRRIPGDADAIQLELGRSFRLKTETKSTAKRLADAIVAFSATYLPNGEQIALAAAVGVGAE